MTLKTIPLRTIALMQLILLLSCPASWAKETNHQYKRVYSSPKLVGSVKTVAIPAETVLNLTLNSPVNSTRNKVGDKMLAVIKEPVYVGPYLAIPSGTQLSGQVLEVNKKAQKRGPNPYIIVNFTRLQRPNEGLTYPVQANLIAYRTGLKSTDYLWKLPQKHDRMKEHLGSTLGGAAVGFFINPVFGTAIGAGAGLLKSVTISKVAEHGSIKIKAGQEIPISLEKPVKLPIATQHSFKTAALQ
jgi:hypothetical protein